MVTMAKKQPLYPHVPKKRSPAQRIPSYTPDIVLRFLPDSPEFLNQTMRNTGLGARLEGVFLQAIDRANGVK